jgi:starch synthase
VRATGGLADTVTNYRVNSRNSTGFVFKSYTPKSCRRALDRAMKIYRDDKKAWRELQRRGMSADFSWETSAQKYVELYQKAIQLHREAQPPA